MRFADLTDSELARQIGLRFCRYAPRWLGHLVARVMRSVLVRYMPEMHLAVEQNLRQALGARVSDAEIQAMARRTMGHYTRASFDFLSTGGEGREEILADLRMSRAGVERIKEELARGQGVLVVFPHISNFDLAGIALTAAGLPGRVLTLSNPSAVLREQNRLREISGMQVTPISSEALRDAIRSIRAGGIVFSGLDRPVPRQRDLIEFFGRPSYLPLGPARMALISGATVFVAGCRYEEGEGYTIDIFGPVEMVRTGKRRDDVLTNSRKLAMMLEGLVRTHPEQWLMFHPVWPLESDSAR